MKDKLQPLMSSAKDDWETPEWLFYELDCEFGFTVDVACTADNAKCETFFDAHVDGLSQSWQGHTCFMNPPYGRQVGAWVRKAYMEWVMGGCTVVALLPSRTDTAWFHSWINGFAEVRFLRGRLKFEVEGIPCKNAAPFPSMVVVWK